MSHYTVLLIGLAHNINDALDVIVDMLDPYSEHLEVDEYLTEMGDWSIEYYTEKFEEINEREPTNEELVSFMNEQECFDYATLVDGEILRKSTYNPDSKWDWWVIGGRWSGLLNDYVKEGYDSRKVGRGRAGVFDNEVGIDVAFINQLDIEKMKEDDFGTYAVLDEDGWHERGEMGWFGLASNEKDEDEWSAMYRKLVYEREYSDDHFLAVIDCHI